MDEYGRPPLSVTVGESAVVIVPETKELTFRNAKEFLADVKRIVEANEMNIVLDLSRIDIIDSVSLGSLVAMKKFAVQRGHDVAITGLSDTLMELFSLLNFTRVFAIFDTPEECLVHFRNK